MKNYVLIFLLVSTMNYGQTITHVKTANSNKLDKLYFALPETKLNVTVSAERKWMKAPGFETKNMEIEEVKDSVNAKPEQSETLKERVFTPAYIVTLPEEYDGTAEFKIQSVTVSAKAKIDKENVYMVSTDRKWNKKNAIGLNVSSSGLITGASIESKDLTMKYVTTFISLAAMAVSGETKAGSNSFNPKTHGHFMYSNMVENNLRNQQTEEVSKELKALLKLRDKYKVQIEKFNTIVKKLKKGVIEKNIFPGGVAMTKMRLELAEKDLGFWKEKNEKNKAEFIKVLYKIFGKVEITTINKNFDLDWCFPAKNHEDIYKKISNVEDDHQIEISDADSKNFAACEQCLKFSINKKEASIGDVLKETASSSFYGMPYKMPESFVVKVESNQKVLGEYPLLATGKVGRLNSKLNISEITYYEQLGWIKSFKASNKNVETADLDSLGSSLIANYKNLKGKSEVDLLTEETTLLELKLKKLQTEAALDSIINPSTSEVIENQE